MVFTYYTAAAATRPKATLTLVARAAMAAGVPTTVAAPKMVATALGRKAVNAKPMAIQMPSRALARLLSELRSLPAASLIAFSQATCGGTVAWYAPWPRRLPARSWCASCPGRGCWRSRRARH